VVLLFLLGCGSTPLWVENKVLSLEQENFQQDEELLLLGREVEALRAEIEAMRTQTHQALHEAGVGHPQRKAPSRSEQ